MAFEKFIAYRSNAGDASRSIIERYDGFLRKGFVQAWSESLVNESAAPTIVPTVGALTVTVNHGSYGWIAVSQDGMVIKESSADYVLSVTAGTKYYIVLRAYYVASVGGEIIEFNALTAADYTSSPYKSQFIIVGTIDAIVGVDASTGVVSYNERDRVEGLFDTRWRPSVDTFANLPTIVTDPFLKLGDCIIVRDSLTIYGWNGSAFITVGGAAAFFSAAGRQQQTDLEYLRSLQGGSGVIAGNSNDPKLGYGPTLNIHEHASTQNSLGIGEIRALINGHFVRTRIADITMVAKPGGTRYDIVYLEVYRLVLATPTTVVYPDAGGGNLTAAQMTAALEELTAAPTHNASSFDVVGIEYTSDNQFVALIWSLRSAEDITIAGVEDPYDFTGYTGNPQNSDVQNWSWSSAQTDQRVWISDHSLSYDGKAWALPICIVLRTNAEDHTIADGIKIYRNGVRHITPIYPESNLLNLREPDWGLFRAQTQSERPSTHSGFLNRANLVTSGGLGTIMDHDVHLVVNGSRVLIPFARTALTLSASPAAGSRRDLVAFRCRFVAFPDEESTTRTVVHLGWFAPLNNGGYGPNYPKGHYLQVDIEDIDVGEVEDIPEAMSALGYTLNATDSGLWELVDASYDLRANYYETTYLIPVALIPRYNSVAWNSGVNPNGAAAASRPDSIVHSTLSWKFPQCWHLVSTNEWQLQQLLEESVDLLLRGQLWTLIQRHPSHAGVAGVEFLMAEAAASAPIAGHTVFSASPDGNRHLWSEAEEIRPFGVTIDPDGGAYADGIFTWDGINHLQVVMPLGMAVYVSDLATPADGLHLTLYDMAGPPNNPLLADHTGAAIASRTTANVVVNATDSFGYPTDIEMDLLGAPITDMHIYFWVIHKRSDSDVQHQDNGGLTQVPDNVHSGTWGVGGVGNELGVRPMVATVSKAHAGGNTITFNAAELAAVIDEGGAATYRALLGFSVEGISRASFAGYTVQMGNGGVDMTIDFGVALGAGPSVNIIVAYQTANADRWVEFSRAARSVAGFFKWIDIEWTGVAAATTYYSAGSGNLLMRFAGLYWRNTASADPWDLIPYDQYTVDMHEGSDLVELLNIAVGYQSPIKDYRLVFCAITPPAAAGEDFIIYYTASPYQGRSAKFGIVSKLDEIGALLQGEVVTPGIALVTTAGYLGYYNWPPSAVESNIVRTAFDLDYVAQHAARSKALIAAGQGLWRLRQHRHDTADDNFTRYSIYRDFFPDGYDAVVDRLPWPDWAAVGNAFIPGDGNLEWSAVTYGEWDLQYQELLLGGEVVGGGYLLWLDDSFSAPQVGAVRPRPGRFVEYGTGFSAGVVTAMETESFRDADRGIQAMHRAYDSNAALWRRFVADGVGFLAFGNIEGLHYADADEGVAGMLLPRTPPSYLNVGTPYRINTDVTIPTAALRYYGGHAMLIRATGGGWPNLVSLQVAGGPKEISGVSPQAPYEIRIGGVFDAFYPIGRPLLPNRT